MAKIALDEKKITRVKEEAKLIANEVQTFIDDHSSTSVERAALRLYGVDGACSDGTPFVNKIIELTRDELPKFGITKLFAAALIKSKRDINITAELLATS
jgi:beta-lysine 5,6-aminomutase alpha subunit